MAFQVDGDVDIEIEQELSRPYAYTSIMLQTGTDIISIKDPSKAYVLWQWRAPNAALLAGTGAMDNKYFKVKGRYYDLQSLQFGQQGPDADIGAHIVDVTSLPDTSGIKDKFGSIEVDDALLGQTVSDAQNAATFFAGLPVSPAVQAQFPANGQITGNLTIFCPHPR